MYEDNSVEYRYTHLTRVKHSQITTAINSILEPHSFEDQCNMLKFIMKHNSLSEYFKLLG